MSTLRNSDVFLRMIDLPIRLARESASSVLPACANLFFRRNSAFTFGVTYGGSDDVIVIVRSGYNRSSRPESLLYSWSKSACELSVFGSLISSSDMWLRNTEC